MLFAGTQQRVEEGNALSGIVGAGKQIVLSPQCNGPDPVLYEVVVNSNDSIPGEARQLIPSIQRIADGDIPGQCKHGRKTGVVQQQLV